MWLEGIRLGKGIRGTATYKTGTTCTQIPARSSTLLEPSRVTQRVVARPDETPGWHDITTRSVLVETGWWS